MKAADDCVYAKDANAKGAARASPLKQEKELVDKFNEFKMKGETDAVAKTSVLKTLKKKNEALDDWRETKAEILLKAAAEKILRDTKRF